MSTKPISPTAATRFDLSAAALHILAMALMLMGSPVGDPVTRAGMADLCRASGLSYICFYGGGRVFPHP